MMTLLQQLSASDELLRELLGKDVSIPFGHFTYHCRLKVNPNAKYLSVQLHGDIPNKAETPLPVFGRWNWGKILGAHVLSICDPTLYLDDKLSLGWYLGDKENSVIPGLVSIAERCSKMLGLPIDNIVYSGSSGGGFAALHAAAMVSKGKAIVINPQTNLMVHQPEKVLNYLNVIGGFSDIHVAESHYGMRLNAIKHLNEALSQGREPRVVYVQNINDSDHYPVHFLPFAQNFKLEVDTANAICGNMMSILYHGPHGHVVESTDVIKRIIDFGLPFVLDDNPNKINVMPPDKINVMPPDEIIMDEHPINSDFTVLYKSFTYPCRLKLNANAKYLSVQLHGTVPRDKKTSLPVYAHWDWGKKLGAHVLSICDPTIYCDDSLRNGWYLGTPDVNVTSGVVAIAERCAKMIGCRNENIIYCGTACGGFAALQAAAMSGGRAICINPQTNISRHDQGDVLNFVEKVTGFVSMEHAQEIYGDRWDAILHLQRAAAQGQTPKIVIIQNKNDRFFNLYFTPFAEAFGLDQTLEQSINDGFMSIVYNGQHDDDHEPPELVKYINSDGIPFLLDLPKLNVQVTVDGEILSARIDAERNGLMYACYFIKDGVFIEKQFYTEDNHFSCKLRGPGVYKCRGFVRDSTEQVTSAFSGEIRI